MKIIIGIALVAVMAGSVSAALYTEDFSGWAIGSTNVQGGLKGGSGISTWNAAYQVATNGITGFTGNSAALVSGDNRYAALRVYLAKPTTFDNVPDGSTRVTISFDMRLEDLADTSWPVAPTVGSVRDNDGGTPHYNVTFATTALADSIVNYTATFALNAAQVAEDELYLHIALGTGPNDGGKLPAAYQDVVLGHVDNVSVNVIPEPATLGLVAGFAGAVLFIRRRFMM